MTTWESWPSDFEPDFGEPEELEESFVPPLFTELGEFAETEEKTSKPLLGSSEDPLLPLGGMLIMYGDGGAGKTTLTLDVVAHLAAGKDWTSLGVSEPTRVTMIENEGPRGMFRQKVRAKIASWNGGPPFARNVTILEEPWTRFTLADPRHRISLARHVEESESELVVMGPLTTLGMVGGGTPDEILAFEQLLLSTREESEREFSWWIVHHENKSGDVSGAWQRVPDVLCHVQSLGNGHTKVVWRKARWSTTLHGTSIDLVWAPGSSYEVREDVHRDLHEEVLAALAESGIWMTARDVMTAISANLDATRNALSDLTERGVLEFQRGPEGRHASAKCWRISSGEPHFDTSQESLI